MQSKDSNMAKNQKPSESRWKEGRLSIRIHEDLRSALEFLASKDHRALSNYVELSLVQIARERLANPIGDFGEREDDRPWVRRIDVDIVHSRPAPGMGGMRGFPPKKR
jgi:hypothetical protein